MNSAQVREYHLTQRISAQNYTNFKNGIELTHFYTEAVFVVKKYLNDLCFPRFATDNSLGLRSDHSPPLSLLLSGPNKLTPLVQLRVLTHLAFRDNFSVLNTYVGVAFGNVACSITLILMAVFSTAGALVVVTV